TYIEMQRLEYLEESNELIWWSERDGWGHYYLYGTDGTLKKQITSGPFSCRRISEIDQKSGVIFFSANAREPGEDPYYTHFYRVNLNGSGLRLLNPGNFSHSASMDESMKYFVDNFSRVDTVPKSILYDARGQQLVELEEADLSRLFEAGYQFPEPFRVKADDDITDLYGVMYKPFDLDETKQYPIIAYVYPGPQTESVGKTFSTNSTTTSLAQFGFIVITVGNRGGHPTRSKWYHNYSYGDLRDYGLADKKTTIEQLAHRYPFIDSDRVGIFGHSGGGFMSTAAMLVYPDFFKVAVSSSGNHENNIYNKWWSEKHHGVTEVINEKGEVAFEYDIDKNSELAANLKGRLLLVHGDIDNNVHPANTLRLARALIRANKRFDLFIFPGARHGFGDMNNYFFWLRADYFCKHLLGDYSSSVNMIELSREQDQSPDRGRRGGTGRR
ncbi:MAG: S9 family peptidase, partial [Candidatus Krumholzibacteria bacterium]|nr:S9 family peptidase [Candidatus Krumholzibacteria bacterium]